MNKYITKIKKILKELGVNCTVTNTVKFTHFIIKLKNITTLVELNPCYSKSKEEMCDMCISRTEGRYAIRGYMPTVKTKSALSKWVSCTNGKPWGYYFENTDYTCFYRTYVSEDTWIAGIKTYITNLIQTYKNGIEWSEQPSIQKDREMFLNHKTKIDSVKAKIRLLEKEISAANKEYNSYRKKRWNAVKRLNAALKDFKD